MSSIASRGLRRTRAAWLVLLVAPLAVVLACEEDDSIRRPGGVRPDSGPASGCTPDIETIQKTVFRWRCNNRGCHVGPAPAARLDLDDGGVEDRLVGVGASDCPGQVLVVPGKPEASYLVRKLVDEEPACNARMPSGPDTLPEGDIACIQEWIATLPASGGGASRDAGQDQ